MSDKLHDLTMLYLRKKVSDEISPKDLARLYDETYRELKKEFDSINKENSKPPVPLKHSTRF